MGGCIYVSVKLSAFISLSFADFLYAQVDFEILVLLFIGISSLFWFYCLLICWGNIRDFLLICSIHKLRCIDYFIPFYSWFVS